MNNFKPGTVEWKAKEYDDMLLYGKTLGVEDLLEMDKLTVALIIGQKVFETRTNAILDIVKIIGTSDLENKSEIIDLIYKNIKAI